MNQPDYTTDIEPLENGDQSNDADIAAFLSAVTVRPIPIADAENYLDFRDLAKRSPRAVAWTGPLPDAMDNPLTPAALRDGLEALFSHVNKPRSVQIDTTAEPWATQAAELLAGLVAAGILSADDADGFVALGGGLRFGDVTAADVAALRDAHAAAEVERLAAQRLTNAKALFTERMTEGGDAAAVWSQAWTDAGV